MPEESEKPQSAGEIASTLKERIISLKYKPGRGLSASTLADEFKVSREPIRQAMLRLCEEGFVESFPKSGSRVSLINLERTANERFLRKSTELYAIGTFAVNRTHEDLQKMKILIENQQKSIEQKDFYRTLQLDNAFHRTIFQAIGKQSVWQMVYNHSPNDFRVRLLTSAFLGFGIVNVIEQHQDIVKAAEERDAHRAKQILEAHLTRSEDDLTRVIIMFPDIFTSKQTPTASNNIRSFPSGVDEYFHSLLVERHLV